MKEEKQMEHPPAWGDTLRVWWYLFWRTLLFTVGAFVGTTAIVAFVLGFTGLSDDKLSRPTAFIAAAVTVTISVIPVRMIIGQKLGRYRLMLTSEDEKERR
jgi:ABC-type Fe3+ transport system permease subunit